MKITESWRAHQKWSQYLGKEGLVLATSMMEVAATERLAFLPYSYLLIDLGEEHISVMGVAHQEFQIGDQVKLVLRKLKAEAESDIIVYGLKALKI